MSPAALDSRVAFPGIPASGTAIFGYSGGYWLGLNHPDDARLVASQLWQVGRPPGSLSYWHRAGLEDALSSVEARIDLNAPYAPANANVKSYTGGWNFYMANWAAAQRELQATLPRQLQDVGDLALYWRTEGIKDAARGAQFRFPGQAPAQLLKAPRNPPESQQGSYVIPAPPMDAGGSLPLPFPFLEVVAELPLIGPIPYDLAVGIRQLAGGGTLSTVLSSAVRFSVLGRSPRDSQQGFHLSGPSGPLAKYVAQNVAAGVFQPDPRAYGLRAWVATKTKGDIRLLGSDTLQQLGVQNY